MANDDQFRVLDQLRQPVWVFDPDNLRVHWANEAGLIIWQAQSLEELSSRDMGADMSPEIATRLEQYRADLREDPSAVFNDVWTLYPNGQPATLHVVHSAFPLDDGRMAMLVEGLQDHPLDADGLRSVEALVHTPVMITLYDQAGVAIYRNPASRAALKDGPSALEEHFSSPADYRSLTLALRSTGVGNITAQVNAFGEVRWHDISARRCHDPISGQTAWLLSEVDVSSLKSAEHCAQFLANHDTLTQLPNRNYVNERFGERLAEVRERGEQGAIVFIDLDNFKDVNDSLGHAAGDRLLMETADRLRAVVRQGDLIARLGGDEFLILASARDIREHLKALSARVTQALSEPVVLDGREVSVTPTLGVSLFPDDGEDLETLMRHADLAVYEAKARGRNTLVFFTPQLSAVVNARLTLERDLRRAFERAEFEVFYQPRVRLSDGQICGVEALARWHHPTRGLVEPDDFVSTCERMGYIDELAHFVVERSFQAQAEWERMGYQLGLSLNLSPLQLGTDHLIEDLLALVKRYDRRPKDIMLEITESVLLGHDAPTAERVKELREVGFRIAIDDFGTGYSNLAYLHRYPLDCLKIDRSFINGLNAARPVTELIVSMAQLLKMDIIAEGIETAAQLDWVRERGCLEYQGFLFSPPVPQDALVDILQCDAVPLGPQAAH
ncbi:MAG: EAL domain-containing protein [Pseudomonadota bacterium]